MEKNEYTLYSFNWYKADGCRPTKFFSAEEEATTGLLVSKNNKFIAVGVDSRVRFEENFICRYGKINEDGSITSYSDEVNRNTFIPSEYREDTSTRIYRNEDGSLLSLHRISPENIAYPERIPLLIDSVFSRFRKCLDNNPYLSELIHLFLNARESKTIFQIKPCPYSTE